ncbi:hypothetical protein X975_22694, partial [Stegodyphus mimosarum]
MAYRYCRFKDCKSKCMNRSKSERIHFYTFPRDEQRCQAWVKASQNDKLIGIPASELYKKAYLCMFHFQDWCFTNVTTKHRLVHNAVPCCPKSHVTKNAVLDQQEPNLSNTPFSSTMDYHLISPVPVQGPHNQRKPVASSTPKSLYSARKYTPRKSVLANSVKKYRDFARRLKLKVALQRENLLFVVLKKRYLVKRLTKKFLSFSGT